MDSKLSFPCLIQQTEVILFLHFHSFYLLVPWCFFWQWGKVRFTQSTKGIKRRLHPVQFCSQMVLLKSRWLATREVNECGIEDGTENSMLFNKWTVFESSREDWRKWGCKNGKCPMVQLKASGWLHEMTWLTVSSVALIDTLACLRLIRRVFVAGISVCMM